jgi:hypothetical protein
MVNERTPLRLLSVSGIPTIGEFQSGDVVAILKGGTGTSSLGQLKDDLGLGASDLTLSSLYDIDPSLRAGLPGGIPSTGDSLVWTGSFWGASAITGGGGVTDHGALTGLSDNDHPQYTLSSTNNALSSLVTSVETSTVALSSYVSTNEALWASATPASALDHGGLQGLSDNDHPQYTLSSTNNALSSLVTSVETSTVALSSYVSTNEALWASATPASALDHGGLQGLGDDDHPQYLLADGSRVATASISIESTDASPPSNPVALVLKTIDSSPANATNIGEVRFSGNNDAPANKVYNRLRGVADDVGAGSEDGSIELRHLLAGSEVVSLIASGGGVTVEESLTVSTCPVPAPVCYAQMDGDGTAAASETKFGAGVTPTTVQDSTGHITWDNTNKEFDISVAGTYHVMATLVLNVGTTTLTTIRVKNGATAKNTYVDHGTHAAEDPEEVTIQAAFTCAASDSITVTFQDDGATNINLMAGSSVTVRRLF